MSYERIRAELTVSLKSIRSAIDRFDPDQKEGLDEDGTDVIDLMLQAEWRIKDVLKELGGEREE